MYDREVTRTVRIKKKDVLLDLNKEGQVLIIRIRREPRTPGRTSHPPDGSEGALWNNIITCIYLPSHFFGHRY